MLWIIICTSNCEVGKAVEEAVTLRPSHRMFAWPKFDTGLISLTTVWGRQKNREKERGKEKRGRRRARKIWGILEAKNSAAAVKEAKKGGRKRWKLCAQEVRTYPRTHIASWWKTHLERRPVLHVAKNEWKWGSLVEEARTTFRIVLDSGRRRQFFLDKNKSECS